MTAENVKTAGRTLDLFEVFARKRAPLSLSELALQIGCPVSSAHALIRTLRARGYVYVLDERKLIYPTKRLLAIAQMISQNDPVVEFVLPVLRHIQKETNETVILGKRQVDHIVYLEILESSRSIRYSARPGDTKPLHSSAIGKAMLGLMADDALAAWVKSAELKRVTDNTIVKPALLLRDIRAGRKKNVFITRGENVSDVMAVAANVAIAGESFGIAIAGPAMRVEPREDEFAALLADSIERLRPLDPVAFVG